MILKKYPTAIHMREAKVFNLVKICRRVQGNSYSKDFAFKLIKTVKEFIYSGKAYRVREDKPTSQNVQERISYLRAALYMPLLPV